MTTPPRPAPRDARDAREAALSVLYLIEMGRATPAQALDTFFAEHRPDAPEAVREFTDWLVAGTARLTPSLDEDIGRHSTHWRVERLAVVDRIILRLALFELQARPEQAPAIVINEALELARRYSGEASVRFVNGVLDAVRKQRSEPADAADATAGPAEENEATDVE